MNSPTSGLFFRVTVIGLLALVAFQLYRIESKMPPTRAALVAMKSDEERIKFWQSLPMVSVSGDVEVSGSVSVANSVRLSEPVAVVLAR